MKIGLLVWDLNIKGGTQRQVLKLGIYLQKMSQAVTIYTYIFNPQDCYPDLCSQLNIKYVKIGNDEKKFQYSLFIQQFLKYSKFYFEKEQKELLKIIDKDIEILNPHDYRVYVTAGLWRAAFGRPVAWMMNDMPMYKMNLRKKLKTVLFYIKPKFCRYIKSFEKIVVLDNFNKRLVKQNFGIDSIVVRSGVDTEQFSFSRHGDNEKFIILINGIFYPHRRFEDVIFALDILLKKGYDIKLYHIGSDNRSPRYSKKIYNLVKKLKLKSNVFFFGQVTEKELIEHYHNSDLFVYPNYPQTWGLAVFEAMASGLPVLLTSGCGASEVLRDNENSFIVEPQNPLAMAKKIEYIYNHREILPLISYNARGFVEENLTWESYSNSMLAIFNIALHGWKK